MDAARSLRRFRRSSSSPFRPCPQAVHLGNAAMTQSLNGLEHPTDRFAPGIPADAGAIRKLRFRTPQTVNENHQRGNR
ncbi:hypothetical protein BJS_09016 [Bradyrhizobium japonicum SEMIA 5079]|nr:hypothetical protein BJS_09016 [Bradyrhizobium japonicum SEMIA 5079]